MEEAFDREFTSAEVNIIAGAEINIPQANPFVFGEFTRQYFFTDQVGGAPVTPPRTVGQLWPR
jgi:hypothetical protein